MALTIAAPASGSRVGPGISVSIHSSLVGPTANDDVFVIELYNSLAANYFTLGADFAHALHDRTLVLGTNLTDISFNLGRFDHDIAPGDAATINAYLAHHDLTVIDGPTTFTGFVWDPTSGLYNLSAPQAGPLGAILAAVYRTFPAS